MPTVSASTLPSWAAADLSRRPSASQRSGCQCLGQSSHETHQAMGHQPHIWTAERRLAIGRAQWPPEPRTSSAITEASALRSPPPAAVSTSAKLWPSDRCRALGKTRSCLQSSAGLEHIRNTRRGATMGSSPITARHPAQRRDETPVRPTTAGAAPDVANASSSHLLPHRLPFQYFETIVRLIRPQ